MTTITKRSVILASRVSPEEKEYYRAMANQLNISLSDLTRLSLESLSNPTCFNILKKKSIELNERIAEELADMDARKNMDN